MTKPHTYIVWNMIKALLDIRDHPRADDDNTNAANMRAIAARVLAPSPQPESEAVIKGYE